MAMGLAMRPMADGFAIGTVSGWLIIATATIASPSRGRCKHCHADRRTRQKEPVVHGKSPIVPGCKDRLEMGPLPSSAPRQHCARVKWVSRQSQRPKTLPDDGIAFLDLVAWQTLPLTASLATTGFQNGRPAYPMCSGRSPEKVGACCGNLDRTGVWPLMRASIRWWRSS